MAEKTVALYASDGTAAPVTYRDNGDGSYSLQSYAASGAVPSNSTTAVYAASRVIKASAGTLYGTPAG